MSNETTVNSFLLQIGRIEGKLDMFLQLAKDHADRMNRIDQDIEDIRKDLDNRLRKDVDLRLRTLELRMYAICTGITFLAAVLLKFVG